MNQKFSLLFGLLLVLPGTGHAALISPVSVSGTGNFTNSPNLIIDGTVPTEGSSWSAATNVRWSGVIPAFTIDLGAIYNVDDVLVSVDNNDHYSIEWSTDSTSWNNLFSINAGNGEIGWGMDTMSTDSTNSEYVSALEFSSVQAQYLRVFATGGDNLYSIGEFQTYGSNVSNVPVPAAVWLFGTGLIGLSRMKKNHQK